MAKIRQAELEPQDISVGLQWYSLERFGYYYARTPKDYDGETGPVFGELPVICSQVAAWCRRRSRLASRQVCTPTKDHDGLYIFRMVELPDSGDFILIVVEAYKDSKKGIMYWPTNHESSQKVKPEYTKGKPGYIAGMPFYYWIVPSKNSYAALRIDSRINKTALEDALKSFMSLWSSFGKDVSIDKPNGDVVEKRVFKNPDWIRDNQNARRKEPAYRPRVQGKLSRVHGERDKIRFNRASIKEYIIKAEFDATRGIDRKLLRLISKLTNKIIPDEHPKVSVQAHIEITPTEEELEALFEAHDLDEAVATNIGFVYEGESTPYWLENSRNYERHLFQLTYESPGKGTIPGIVDIGSLAYQIELNRNELLKSL